MSLDFHVQVLRGDIVESRHRIEFALVDADGRRVASTDSPELLTTFRSGAKPFQLLPLVERGHAERWGFRDEELAVMVASHTGSDYHLALVRGILERVGVDPDRLACGYHDPDDPASLSCIRSGRIEPTPLYNGCSGKHAGLLALAQSEGWPLEGYHRAGHPVQQLVHETVADACCVEPGSMQTAVDGCSVVVFALPLHAMALGYARLADATREPGPDARGRALARIGRAMAAHPRAVEGEGRISTAVMEATGGRLLAKCGAEGLQMIAVPARGLGLAIKCVDGAQRAMGPATVSTLEHLSLVSREEAERLAPIRGPQLRNAKGLHVGRITTELREGAAR